MTGGNGSASKGSSNIHVYINVKVVGIKQVFFLQFGSLIKLLELLFFVSTLWFLLGSSTLRLNIFTQLVSAIITLFSFSFSSVGSLETFGILGLHCCRLNGLATSPSL